MENESINTAEKAFAFRKALGGFNKDDVIDFISDENKKFKAEREELKDRIESEARHAAELEEALASLRAEYEKRLAAKDKEIETLSKRASEAEAKIEAFEKVAADYDEKIEKYEKAIAEKDRIIAAKDETVAALETEASNLALRNGELTAGYSALIERLNSFPAAKEEAPKEVKIEKEIVPPHEMPAAPIAPKIDSVSKRTPVTARESARQLFNGSIPRAQNDDKEAQTRLIAEKAIRAIEAINEDVRRYLAGCVGEFNECSKDISNEIAKLLYVISERCRVLDDRLKAQKEKSDVRIDLDIESFKNNTSGTL